MVPKLLERDHNECTVLELCCFEWFQNPAILVHFLRVGFRAVLFRMVPKLWMPPFALERRFRAVLFRMVPKPNFIDFIYNLLF